MSGYLVSLVERARGEGAALQPRVRGRFEPGGFAETAIEHEGSAPPGVLRASGPLLREAPAESTATLLLRESSSSVEHHLERSVPPAMTPSQMDATPLLVERVSHDQSHQTTIHRNEHHVRERTEARIREIKSGPEARDAGKQERTPRAPLPVHATRTHHERNEHTTTRERTIEQAEPQPVHITIGRIDVRAVLPQARQPRPPAKPKVAAPLTLDDYLRGKR